MRKFEELTDDEQEEALKKLKQFNLDLLRTQTVVIWRNVNVEQALSGHDSALTTRRLGQG